MHETIAAKGHYSLAAGLQPDKPLWQLRALICAPVVFDSAEEIGAYREGVKKLVEEWNNNSPSPPAPLPQTGEGGNSPSAPCHLPGKVEGNWGYDPTYSSRSAVRESRITRSVMSTGRGTAQGLGLLPSSSTTSWRRGCFPVFLSYHGRDQRRLKERFAALYEPCFRDQPPPTGSGLGDRTRVGILVTRRHERMFLQSMRGIVERLDLERFEVVILASRAIVESLRAKLPRRGPAVHALRRLAPRGDPADPRGGLRPDLLLGSGQRRDELLPALRPAFARAMHRLGLDDHLRRAGRRLVPVQRTGRAARLRSRNIRSGSGSRGRCGGIRTALPATARRLPATSACPRAGTCTSAFRTR